MFDVFAIGTMIVSMLAAPAVGAAGAAEVAGPTSAPPAGKVVVEVVTVNGSGCPAGSAAVAVSADNSSFRVTFAEYTAEVGGGAELTDMRKNCQLSLRVQVPDGYTYTLARAEYLGFAHLAGGVNAAQNAYYYFQGMSQTAQLGHSFAGPFSDNWQTVDTGAEVGVAGLGYSPCGDQRNLNINTELRVTAATADARTTTSFISMDAAHGSVQAVYQFGWKQCV